MSGIKDVAKRAGVSISTVSNVLNGKKFVSEELKKKVLIAVRELNYEVDPIARNMKTKNTKTIGVITEDICGLFYPFLVKGIYEVADQRGYQVMICDSSGQYGERGALDRERANFDKLFANRVDGIIFTSVVTPETDGEYLRSLKKRAVQNRNIPLVSLEQNFTEYGIDSVYFDGYASASMATEHLIDCGCKKIAHVTGPITYNIAKERVWGFRDTIKKAGLELNEKMIAYGDYTHQSGYLATKTLLADVEDIDGIFYANDQMALGALKALQEMNLRIPDDIKIMGYDDAFISSLVEPPLSTIHIPKKNTGKAAVQLLFDRLEGEKKTQEAEGIRMDGRLVIRKSTVADAVDDWILSDW